MKPRQKLRLTMRGDNGRTYVIDVEHTEGQEHLSDTIVVTVRENRKRVRTYKPHGWNGLATSLFFREQHPDFEQHTHRWRFGRAIGSELRARECMDCHLTQVLLTEGSTNYVDVEVEVHPVPEWLDANPHWKQHWKGTGGGS